MSLLAPNQPSVEPTRLARQTARLLATPRQVIEQLYLQWSQSFDLVWSDHGGVTPAQRLAALGVNGGELMNRSAELVTFLLTQLSDGNGGFTDPEMSAAIMARIAAKPATETSAEGVVTINLA